MYEHCSIELSFYPSNFLFYPTQISRRFLHAMSLANFLHVIVIKLLLPCLCSLSLIFSALCFFHSFFPALCFFAVLCLSPLLLLQTLHLHPNLPFFCHSVLPCMPAAGNNSGRIFPAVCACCFFDYLGLFLFI